MEDFNYNQINKQNAAKHLLKSYGIDMKKGSTEEERKVKFKKVMDEWKAGTLKTPAGEKVTDQKQAIAIAISESGLNKSKEMIVDTQDMINEHKKLINVLESESHKDDKEEAEEQKKELKEYEKEVKKALEILESDILKGVYKDNSLNRKLGIVGQTYGGDKNKKEGNKQVILAPQGNIDKESVKNLISGLEKELNWNDAKIKENEDGTLDYSGLPGESMIKEIKSAAEKLGFNVQVNRHPYSDTSRRALEHNYIIKVKKKN